MFALHFAMLYHFLFVSLGGVLCNFFAAVLLIFPEFNFLNCFTRFSDLNFRLQVFLQHFSVFHYFSAFSAHKEIITESRSFIYFYAFIIK